MKVIVTGHRPSRITGEEWVDGRDWTKHPNTRRVIDFLDRALEGIASQGGEAGVVAGTGLALGTDQIFAHLCHRHRIPFVAFVPYPGFAQRWGFRDQVVFGAHIANAVEVRYTAQQYSKGVELRRNRDMVDWLADGYLSLFRNALALAVWDGRPTGGTHHTIQLIDGAEIPAWVLNPITGKVEQYKAQ